MAGRTVLLVEDDEDIRVTLAEVLRESGYEVASCQNGEDALDRLQSGARSDVILLDLMMPVMDGWAFRVAQKRHPELAGIPVVAVTADSSSKSRAIDATAWLCKPVDSATLLATLDRIFLLREREELRARIREQDRLASLGTLAAGVAHEINNPLAYVLASLEMLEREHALPAEDRRARTMKAHAQIRDGLERIRRIVSDLRLFSRPETADLAPVDVRRVLASAANIAMAGTHHQAQIVTETTDDESLFVLADEMRLGQVFINLIVNAVHALPEEGGEVHLCARRQGAMVCIEVKDNGCGIAPELFGHIFEPFFTTKPPGVGTGLGLSISLGIVTALGGSLHVDSAIGQGSCFRVELPATHAISTPVRPPPLGAARRGRVLVVDDEEMICRTFSSLLGREHEVVALTSPRAAEARIAAGERFDVVLSDLTMPELSGIELQAAISRVAPDQAAGMIFLTGGACTGEARAFVDATPNLVLEKPVDWAVLCALVRDRVQATSAVVRPDA